MQEQTKRADITKWYLEKYGDDQNKLVNAVTDAGVTPLMLAVKANSEYIVQELLSANANPFFKDQMGKEASDYNICLKHLDEKNQVITKMIAKAKEQWTKNNNDFIITRHQQKEDKHFRQFDNEKAWGTFEVPKYSEDLTEDLGGQLKSQDSDDRLLEANYETEQ